MVAGFCSLSGIEKRRSASDPSQPRSSGACCRATRHRCFRRLISTLPPRAPTSRLQALALCPSRNCLSARGRNRRRKRRSPIVTAGFCAPISSSTHLAASKRSPTRSPMLWPRNSVLDPSTPRCKPFYSPAHGDLPRLGKEIKPVIARNAHGVSSIKPFAYAIANLRPLLRRLKSLDPIVVDRDTPMYAIFLWRIVAGGLVVRASVVPDNDVAVAPDVMVLGVRDDH